MNKARGGLGCSLGTIRVLAKVLQEEVGTVSWDLGEFCPDAASRELLQSRIVSDFRMESNKTLKLLLELPCKWVVLNVVLVL